MLGVRSDIDDESQFDEIKEESESEEILRHAVDQVDKMRATARAALENHHQEIERLTVLVDAHRKAAEYWSEIAESGTPKMAMRG